MKNNKYWEDRANERMSNYHKNADETVFKINNAYDAAIEDINKEINKIFYKFQSDSGLSIEEAKALLNSNISASELEDIKSKINGIQDKELKKYLMAELNAKAYKARMTRLEAIKESIKVNSAKVAEVQLKDGQKSFINTINDAYYKNIFDTQKGTGLGFDFSSMPVDRIEEILKNNWSGKNYSERVWNNTEALAQKLEETITDGLMQGKGSRKMAAEIEDLSDYGKMAGERLIRTETTYVANAAEMESYKECDIDKYVFVATLDLRTSDICREHDGKIIEVKKGVSGDNLPPLHPYCRSTTIAYMGEEWYKNLKRRARDPETGKTYTVPGNMNYNEWYKKNVVGKYGEQKAETFEKMIKNKASDKKQLEKYKEVLEKESPKTLKDFQKLKYNNTEEYDTLKTNFINEFVKKDFNEIPSFHESCSNLQTRKWYKWHDENIPNIIDKTKSIEDQARQAHELRNIYRTQARDLMKDQSLRAKLDKDSPNKSFEELMLHKINDKKMSKEDAIADILKTATKTIKKVNKSLGLE